MSALELRSIGNSVGVVPPKDISSRLRVGEGDELHVVETKDGIILTPLDPETAAQVALGWEIMHRYRDTLRALAK